MAKNILIVNLFGIGDVLFSTPMIDILKKAYPDTNIDFMCNKRCKPILENNKGIRDIILFEKDDFREAYKSSKVRFAREIQAFMKRLKDKKYDIAIDLSLGHQIALLLKVLGVKKRIGFCYRKRGRFLTDKLVINGFNGKHVVEHYLDILKMMGISDISDKDLRFALSPKDEAWADDFIRRNTLEGKVLIGISPGGGKSWGKYAVYRRWNPENFVYVAEKLLAKKDNAFFLVFGSHEESLLCDKAAKELAEKSINVCGELSLLKSTALIKRCSLFLCNDGGLLHTAVSQGVNTVSIFGPVNDAIYGPYPPSEKHKVVRAEGIECRPCYRNFKHRVCDTHDCLNKIDREEVLKAAEESFNPPAGFPRLEPGS